MYKILNACRLSPQSEEGSNYYIDGRNDCVKLMEGISVWHRNKIHLFYDICLFGG